MKHFSPDELAFLNAIHAEPREDTRRLVYADWLEEQKVPPEPEYAEFIRLDCGVLPAHLTIDGRKKRLEELKRLVDTSWKTSFPRGVFFFHQYKRGLPVAWCFISQRYVESLSPFLHEVGTIPPCFCLAFAVTISPSASSPSENWIDPNQLFANRPPTGVSEVRLEFRLRDGGLPLPLKSCLAFLDVFAASKWADPSLVELVVLDTVSNALRLHVKRLLDSRFPNRLYFT